MEMFKGYFVPDRVFWSIKAFTLEEYMAGKTSCKVTLCGGYNVDAKTMGGNCTICIHGGIANRRKESGKDSPFIEWLKIQLDFNDDWDR